MAGGRDFGDTILYLTSDELAELGRDIEALLERYHGPARRPEAEARGRAPRRTSSAWPSRRRRDVSVAFGTGRVAAARPARENATFRRFWAAQTISLFGDQVTLLALPLSAVLVLDAGPAEMGYLTAAGLAAEPALRAARRRVGRPARPPPPRR